MPEITAAAVKALRDKTNLPMMDCKKALEATGGDEAAAIDKLRKEGQEDDGIAQRAGDNIGPDCACIPIRLSQSAR